MYAFTHEAVVGLPYRVHFEEGFRLRNTYQNDCVIKGILTEFNSEKL